MLGRKFFERPSYRRTVQQRRSRPALRFRLTAGRLKRKQDRARANLSSSRVKRVEQNPEKPGPCVGPSLKLIEVAPPAQQRFLHEVFGRGGIEGEPACDPEQAPRMRHRDLFKFVLPRRHVLAAQLRGNEAGRSPENARLPH